MRGDLVYRVYGLRQRSEDTWFDGVFRTRAEAEARIAEAKAANGGWAARHYDLGFAIREIAIETDFEVPPRPAPREKYCIRLADKYREPGWDGTVVEVFRTAPGAEPEKVCQYERRYPMMKTFEPFRQGERELALISRDHLRIDVLDLTAGLTSGEVIARERERARTDSLSDSRSDDPRDASGDGFYAAGFYVPDWWDLHHGSVVPGHPYWNVDDEWPTGELGLVWGRYPGDERWSLQYLDLRGVQQGVLRRERRFGHLELAMEDFDPPWLRLGELQHCAPPVFLRVAKKLGRAIVTCAVERTCDLSSGDMLHESSLL